jgi:hypothetical protein
MNIEQKLQSARRAIASYERRIADLESGKETPAVGELLGNRLLLERKRRQLRQLEIQKLVTFEPRAAHCY